jgi:hypothetical protein
VEAAEGAAWKADLHVQSLEKAIEALAVEIADQEARERVIADRAEREATSRALNKRADRFEASLAPLVTALAEAADAGSDLVLDYSQHEGFVALARKLLEELPPAVTQLVGEQRDRAAATISGNAPPNLPAPFIPQIVSHEPRPGPEPATLEVFALKHLEWRDQGKRYMGYATQRVHLPTALARRAVDRGVAFLVGDERIPEALTRIQLEARARNGQPEQPVDLSAGDIAPIKHSAFKQPQPQFEEFDRGKPYTVQIDRPKQVDGE